MRGVSTLGMIVADIKEQDEKEQRKNALQAIAKHFHRETCHSINDKNHIFII